jgi:hypothetical protein
MDNKTPRLSRQSAARVGWLIGAGTLLGIATLVWVQNRSGQGRLDEQTRARLRPRHVEPSAADIHIGS